MTSILYIDDEPEFNKAIIETLQDEKYDVVQVKGADEALRRVEEYEYDLIILDLLMPLGKQDTNYSGAAPDLRRTGIELCRTIRQIRVETPIICASVVKDPKIRVEIRNVAGQSKFKLLSKPVLPSEMLTSIEELLER